MHKLLMAALLLVSVAGCIDDDDPAPSVEQAPEPDALPSQVVVAVIDSNANPYHEFFQQHDPIDPRILNSFVDHDGGTVESVQLTQEGTYEERRNADQGLWNNIQPGQLYHFEGTRLLGISFGGNIVDGGTHGIGTTAAVLEANPNAIVILVQGVGGSAGEQWAGQAPFVDILSESYGLYCGQPVLELVPGDSTAKNNKVAWDNGKVPVGAADNTPCPAMNDGTSGPPWVVGVSGDHPAQEGACREPLSGNFPDFTADFTQDLPYVNDVEGTRTVSGTSFATPTTAGSFSKALLQVRQAWNHTGGITDGALALGTDGSRLGQYDLWEAFNQTAYYFATGVCSETGGVPINPAAPWVQMGWGHVDGDVGDHAARVLLGEMPPGRDAAAVAYMEGVYSYRQQVWSTVV